MLLPFYQEKLTETGCDEAGRGCYAGPVFAAAVILPKDFHHPLLNDSKQVQEKQRNILRGIIEKEAISWSVAAISNHEIDEINILKASYKAMHMAIRQLNPLPEFLLIDGNRFIRYPGIAHECIVKGDGKYSSIAAASILAKTHRDEWMMKLHETYPQYGWNRNKGYGTAEHRRAIEIHGLCEHHRKSFNIVPQQLQLPI
ncbi:ribonuclease HII [Sediminibacterium goheungense]|uniref:Ribonuclease HII n=1 Tax=Sediminibacterium goheungense TaxID=1086393 RepID=A0A4R6IVB4_9BACT|nr:ribonuclease HII [Sediminibacterium goheungense]TDO26589.1 RNase HII [Sediminibacterium goheungense]